MAKFISGVLLGGIVVGNWELIRARKEYLSFVDSVVVPLLRMLDAEQSHLLGILAAELGLMPRDTHPDHPILRCKVFNRHFTNCVGLAAGFDKNAKAVGALMECGFGFVEIGSITPEPQPGNEKPRIFRLTEDAVKSSAACLTTKTTTLLLISLSCLRTCCNYSNHQNLLLLLAVINRLGFNNDGADMVLDRLRKFTHRRGALLGVNVGKNKWVTEENASKDYGKVISTLGCYADYLVVNVSSPNTPGLRELQKKSVITKVIHQAQLARTECVKTRGGQYIPLLVKISPDLTEEQKRDIASVSIETQIDGLICCNTTIDRPLNLASKHKEEKGGLSGQPVRNKSTDVIKDMYKLTNGSVPIIGLGGITSGEHAYEKIRAGASLVQIYTSLVYSGPGGVSRIKDELAQLLLEDGYHSVEEAVGADVNLS
eukprot:421339_1